MSGPITLPAVQGAPASPRGAGRLRLLGRAVAASYVRRGWIIALAIGTIVRVEQYLFRRSLWLDEAALAVSVAGRSYRGLLEPLEFFQIAPTGFLWMQRTSVVILGNDEYAHRLVPLIFGLASLLLFLRLARRIVSDWVVPIATLLFAVSPFVVYYSNEAKQYAGDVFAALIVLNVGHRLLDPEPTRLRVWVAFAAAGAVLPWISYPVVFVLAGVAATCAVVSVVRKRWPDLAWLMAAAAAWVPTLLKLSRVAGRYTEQNPSTQTYWASAFPPQGGSFDTVLRWLGRRAQEAMADPVGLSLTGLGMVLLGVGALALLARKRGRSFLLLTSAIPFTVLGSVLHLYPIRLRLLLFLVPAVLLLMAASVDWHARGRAGLMAALLVLALGVVHAAPVTETAKAFADPTTVEEARPVFEHVSASWREGDALYVHAGAESAYRYYGPILGLRASALVVGKGSCGEGGDLSRLQEHARVWVVFTQPWRPLDRGAVRSLIDVVATPIAGFAAPGSVAYLYDPSQGIDPEGRGVVPHPSITCLELRPL